MRRAIIHRRAALCLLVALLALPAMAQAQNGWAGRILEQLDDQGFDVIEMHETLLGRVRVLARGDETLREIVFDPRNGVILRDYSRRVDDDDEYWNDDRDDTWDDDDWDD
ncbi:MAG: hypothetical protein NXH79_11910 [Rhodobacteraceae bacterium]|jgi:hypothetical protein|nr:hypothetical protein [Paracoccaceae bacterium]